MGSLLHTDAGPTPAASAGALWMIATDISSLGSLSFLLPILNLFHMLGIIL